MTRVLERARIAKEQEERVSRCFRRQAPWKYPSIFVPRGNLHVHNSCSDFPAAASITVSFVHCTSHQGLKFLSALLLSIAAVVAKSDTPVPSSAFTYQGRLVDSGKPACGLYDFRFRLALDAMGNSYASDSVLTNGVPADKGLFTLQLDFGPAAFSGPDLWLEIGVRTNGGSNYTILSPLQQVSATPYALMARSASNLLGTISATQLTGTLPPEQLAGVYSTAVVLNNQSNRFLGAFAGDGAGLESLNASNLASGLVPDARLPANIPRLAASNLYAGSFAGDAAALTNIPFPTVTVSPRGIVNGGSTIRNAGAMFGPDTTGTLTSGIQEAIDSLPRATNLFSGSGGGKVSLLAGRFDCTSHLVIPNQELCPFHLVVEGSGMLNTLVNYQGATPQDFIVTAYNPSFSPTNPLNLTLQDCGFTYRSNFTQFILNIGGGNITHISRCMFAWYGALEKNDSGFTANFLELSLRAPLGVAGIFQRLAQNVQLTISDSFFYGLASAGWFQGDDAMIRDSWFCNIGTWYDGSAWHNNSTLWNSGPNSLGAAIIAESRNFAVIGCQFDAVGAMLANVRKGGDYSDRRPVLERNVFGNELNMGYRFLTYDNQSMISRWNLGITTGDCLVTNGPDGKIVPASIKPSRIYDLSQNFVTTGTVNINSGSTAQFSVAFNNGDMTNAGRFSTLGGEAVFTGGVTTVTNFFLFSGAGSPDANGMYYPTAPIAPGVTTWTNTASGALLTLDPALTWNQGDIWQISSLGGTNLYGAGGFDPAFPETVVGFFANEGAAPAPSAFFRRLSTVISSPGLAMPNGVIDCAKLSTSGSVTATNGYFIPPHQAFPLPSAIGPNGIWLWNSNGLLYAIHANETGDAYTKTNLVSQ